MRKKRKYIAIRNGREKRSRERLNFIIKKLAGKEEKETNNKKIENREEWICKYNI